MTARYSPGGFSWNFLASDGVKRIGQRAAPQRKNRLSQFTHLHVHSCYSLLQGLNDPASLVQAAASARMDALALTDHASLTGAVEFAQACKTSGIRPIVGMEITLMLPEVYAAHPGETATTPLVLLATSPRGWASLCALTSVLLDSPENDAFTPCALEVLAGRSNDLICLSGGRRAHAYRLAQSGQFVLLERLLVELRAAFPGRFYCELQIQAGEDRLAVAALAKVARGLSIPLAATQDIYYLRPDQEALQHTLTAIRLARPLGALRPDDLLASGAHFASGREMEQRFAGFPDALQGTQQIAARCETCMPLGSPHFPSVPLPDGKNAAQVLRDKAENGARRLYGEITPALRERLEHELEVITRLNFDPIFLIMEEVVHYARQAGVPISSRGSAASSLVAHCLGITRPDPLALNLYFERFLNPERATPPDIDTDLCSRRRDQVIQHVFETYGAERVAMVGTINRYRPRSALSDVAKAHGFTPAEVRQLAAQLPFRWFWREAGEEGQDFSGSPYWELENRYPSPRYRAVFQQAQQILGLPRHLSVHAGGVVITPGPLTDLLPAQRASKGVRITQLDHKALEPLGIVKLDLLGIRGLTVLGDVAEQLYSWRRSEFANPQQVLDSIAQDDADTAERVRAGQTIGCFQIESPGMRATLREIHAHSVEDIMVALALYRPGPLTGGLNDAFVRRHNRQEAVQHLHPSLARLLDDTYGVILYQEQVLRIAHELAGFSLAESDLLRRAMSHFNPGKQMETLKSKFLAGAEERHGIDAATGERIWELMAAFAGYGFPKAHAASYALVGWQSAWCKTHFPAEFMAAVLANWGGYYSQRVYLMEARRLGLKVRPPHINHSRRDFSVVYPDGEAVLYMGLDQVRDLTRRLQERILRLRPFTSLDDFLTRADPRREEAANLIRCGALDGLGSIPGLLARLETSAHRAGQPSLFAGLNAGAAQPPDWSLIEKMRAQEQILGISVAAHPLELVESTIRAAGAISSLDAAARPGQRVKIAGLRQITHRSRGADGETLRVLSFEDLEGMIDIVVSPDVYRRYKPLLLESRPLLIEGVVELDAGRDEPVLRAEKIALIEAPTLKSGSSVSRDEA